MPTLAFCLSLLALLFAPGPTNALLALSGAETGAVRTLRLLPVVIAAYAITVMPLAALGDDLLRQQHMVRASVTFIAALWVAWMAVTLWRNPGDVATAPDRGGRGLRLFITTLLNPKAFIIGLVLIPAQASRGTSLALFFSVLLAATLAWTMLGGALHRQRTANGLPLLRRICAGWLGLLAVLLGSAALSA
jgi:threonine/homoserine/homoserine lactone efflux protein